VEGIMPTSRLAVATGVSLRELTREPYAINVRQSNPHLTQFVACGAIKRAAAIRR
jgi:hypothetical protein